MEKMSKWAKRVLDNDTINDTIEGKAKASQVKQVRLAIERLEVDHGHKR